MGKCIFVYIALHFESRSNKNFLVLWPALFIMHKTSTHLDFSSFPTGEKAVWLSVFFVYIALHIECRFNKNSLHLTLFFPLQTLFVPDNGAGSPPAEHHKIPLRHINSTTTTTTTTSTTREVARTDNTSPAFQIKTTKSQSFSYTPRSPDKPVSGRHAVSL